MTLQEKLQLFQQEFTTLKSKIQTKLSEKDNTIAQEKQAKQETVTKLETALKEQKADEKELDQLIKEMQEFQL